MIPLTRRNAVTVLFLVVMLCLVGESWRAKRRLHASRTLKAVELVTPSAARAGENGRSVLAAHLRLLAVAHRENPTNVGILVAEGGQLMLLGRYPEAITVLERAERLEPRAEVFIHLARARWLAGLREPALQDFRRALILNPRLRATLPREIVERLESPEKAPLG